MVQTLKETGAHLQRKQLRLSGAQVTQALRRIQAAQSEAAGCMPDWAPLCLLQCSLALLQLSPSQGLRNLAALLLLCSE